MPNTDNTLVLDIATWIQAARASPVEYRRRQVVDIVLNAIAHSGELRDSLLLKGGTLMNLAYQSPRSTTDIDFTAAEPIETFQRKVVKSLNRQMNAARARLGYPKLACKIQGRPRINPPGPNTTFPTVEIRVASADIESNEHKRFLAGRAPHVTKLEISFNEIIVDTDKLMLEPEENYILAYSLLELIAEKYRAILQQVDRNRRRRQDVYDISRLVRMHEFTGKQKSRIHNILITKSKSRNISPHKENLRHPELIERARSEYHTLALEIENETPDFDNDFEVVREFYESLPWPN